jgi:Lar family restriction alleviation protein
MSKLLPCPFCGAPDIVVTRREVFDKSLTFDDRKVWQHITYCRRCSAQVDVMGFDAQQHTNEWSLNECVKKWNTRTAPEDFKLELDRFSREYVEQEKSRRDE